MARSLLQTDRRNAQIHLEAALALGFPEGFLRAFRAEPDIADLLAETTTEGLSDLSERELDVLRLLLTDCSYREIAVQLFLSVNTVKAHARSVYRKLGVHRRSEAAERASRLGLI
jgi:LuxR family maltose regulon positive regulatory protein